MRWFTLVMMQTASLLCMVILSFCVCLPMAFNQEAFRGHCPLFSKGQWQEVDGQLKVDWASQAYCNFIIFVSVVTAVVSSIQLYRCVRYMRRRDATFFESFIDVLSAILMTLLLLVASLFVTLGFSTWCEIMTQRFETCSYAQGQDIDKKDNINSNMFFVHLSVAQFGVWSTFVVSVLFLVSSVVKLCRHHHEENLRVSMAREGKRLINECNEDMVSEVPTTARGDYVPEGVTVASQQFQIQIPTMPTMPTIPTIPTIPISSTGEDLEGKNVTSKKTKFVKISRPSGDADKAHIVLETEEQEEEEQQQQEEQEQDEEEMEELREESSADIKGNEIRAEYN